MAKQKIPLVLIGGGGHCRAVIDVIEQEKKYEIVKILDLAAYQGQFVVPPYRITGTDEDIPALVKKGYHFLITIGQIKTVSYRENMWEILQKHEAQMATVISPLAYVSRHAKIFEGTIIMHGVFVNTYAMVRENCIINSKALIEHDALIAKNCHIATGAIINGNVKVYEGCFIGSNAVVKEGITISAYNIIGAGETIRRNI